MTLDKTLVERDVLVRYCEKYSIAVDGAPTEVLVDRFESFVHERIPVPVPGQPLPEPHQVMCDVCGGDSSSDDECCPYCGSTGVDDSLPAEEPVKPKAKKEAKPKTEPKTEPKPKAKKSKAAPTPEPEPEPAPEPVVIVTSATKPKGNGRKRSQAQLTIADAVAIEKGVVPDTNTGDRSPVGALAVVDDASVESMMRAKLGASDVATGTIEEAIDGVREAKRLHVMSHWHFGRAILRCFEGDLWKQVRDEAGNPRYRGFGAFCENELELTSRYCYTLMEISVSFGVNDVAEVGVAKLGQILKVAPAQREALLEEARGGKPLSAIAKQVKELVVANGGSSGAGAGKKDTSKASKASVESTKKAKGEVITTTHEKKRTRIELYAKVAGRNGAKRAKRLAEDPVGTELCLNGIEIRYSITTDKDGQLLLIVERVRPE